MEKLTAIYSSMFDSFYGNEPTTPSHIKILCSTSFCTKELYGECNLSTNDKSNNNKNNVTKYILKPKHTRDKNTYIAGFDFISTDLD